MQEFKTQEDIDDSVNKSFKSFNGQGKIFLKE